VGKREHNIINCKSGARDNPSDMKVETDLKRIKEAAEKKENENWEFRSFLKGYDIKVQELDSIVHGLFKEVSREIDCTACGNCCRFDPCME
jgi:hypothetical protein